MKNKIGRLLACLILLIAGSVVIATPAYATTYQELANCGSGTPAEMDSYHGYDPDVCDIGYYPDGYVYITTGFHVSYSYGPNLTQVDCWGTGYEHDVSNGYIHYWSTNPNNNSGSDTWYISAAAPQRWEFHVELHGQGCHMYWKAWRWVN